MTENRLFSNRGLAFTLAEILITLGIIGVVAALTIPTLMHNIADAQYKTAYKKAYSELSQAVTKANAENLLTGADSINPRPSYFDNNFLAIMSEFNVTKQCTNNDTDKCWDNTGEFYNVSYPHQGYYAFVDSSGMAWSQYYPYTLRTFVDTNGLKKPNQWGKDRFVFDIFDVNNVDEWVPMDIPIKVRPYSDNNAFICSAPNKCATEKNYFGTSWLLNKN